MKSSDHRAEPVLEKRSKRSHTLLRDVLPLLETLIVTVEGTGETEGIFTLTIPNRLLEEWANSRSTETNFVALVNARIEGEVIAFDLEAARLETQCIVDRLVWSRSYVEGQSEKNGLQK